MWRKFWARNGFVDGLDSHIYFVLYAAVYDKQHKKKVTIATCSSTVGHLF
jgi:hypothetical protein